MVSVSSIEHTGSYGNGRSIEHNGSDGNRICDLA